jgi:hypothetical protein
VASFESTFFVGIFGKAYTLIRQPRKHTLELAVRSRGDSVSRLGNCDHVMPAELWQPIVGLGRLNNEEAVGGRTHCFGDDDCCSTVRFETTGAPEGTITITRIRVSRRELYSEYPHNLYEYYC